VPVSAEVRRGLETRRELAEEAQHCGQVLGAVARHGFLQEQSGLHGNNLVFSGVAQGLQVVPVLQKCSDVVVVQAPLP